MTEEVYDLKGAAAYLGLSPVKLRLLCKEGRVTYSRLHRLAWRFRKSDLDSFIARNTFRAETIFGKEK